MEPSSDAEAIADTELLLEGLSVSLDMMWERLQNECELDRDELSTFIWVAYVQAKDAANQLRKSNSPLD